MTVQRTGDAGQHEYKLFVPDRAPNSDLWNGWRVNRDSAESVFGAHRSFYLADLAQHVRSSAPSARLQARSGCEIGVVGGA
jgi:hypothetical protein